MSSGGSGDGVTSAVNQPKSPAISQASVRSPIVLKPTSRPAPAPPNLTHAKHVGHYKLYKRRWAVLAMFSALAFMNNVVCYTFAPIAHLAQEFYAEAIPLSFLITIFFITYVVFAFPSVRLIDTYGLRPCLIVSAWLMCVGCGMRILSVQANKASAYYMVLFGQTIASLSQCVLVNSPPLLSQVWFGEKERTLATTIAVNCNTMGIAGAYLLGPMLVKDKDDIPFLNTVIFMCTLILAWLVLVFPVAPPSPPSFSSFVKSNNVRREDCCSTFRLLGRKGFAYTVLASAMSESTHNGFATFMNYMLVPKGFDLDTVSLLGSLFIVSCLVGSAVMGVLVDRYKYYKPMMIGNLIGVSATLIWFTILDLQTAPSHTVMTVSVLAVGFFVGPVQPIAIEIAAECTYPASEASFTAIQQTFGNGFSAALVPIMLSLTGSDDSMGHANWVMVVISLCSTISFFFFNGHFHRLELEQRKVLLPHSAVDSSDALAVGGHGVSVNGTSSSAVVVHVRGGAAAVLDSPRHDDDDDDVPFQAGSLPVSSSHHPIGSGAMAPHSPVRGLSFSGLAGQPGGAGHQYSTVSTDSPRSPSVSSRDLRAVAIHGSLAAAAASPQAVNSPRAAHRARSNSSPFGSWHAQTGDAMPAKDEAS